MKLSPDVAALNPELAGKSHAPHKYNAQATTIDGIRFASKKEAKRYQELKLMQASGLIHDLRLQPKYVLQESFVDNTGKRHRAITYVADFAYWEDDRWIVEDTKGVETAVFKIKRKLFLKIYYLYELRVI